MEIEFIKTDAFIENDMLLGDTKIGTVELNPDTKEISRFEIFEPYQNKGYGTKVIKKLIELGYNNLLVNVDNEQAIHVYEKCGFKRVGDEKVVNDKMTLVFYELNK